MANSLSTIMFQAGVTSQQDLTVDASKSCTANGTNIMTVSPHTSGIEDGAVVDGPGVPAGTVVQSHTLFTVTCNGNITAGSEPQTRTFANFPGVEWSAGGPSDASFEDGIPASCAITLLNVGGARSTALVYSNYTFTAALPSGASVVGLALQPVKWCANGFVSDDELYIRMAGVNVGNNLAISDLWTTTSGDGSVFYLGDGQLGGLTIEAPDLQDTGFGLWFKCINNAWDSSDDTAKVDEFYIIVYYQMPTSTLLTMGVGVLVAASLVGSLVGGPIAAGLMLAAAAWTAWQQRTRKTTGRPKRREVLAWQS